MQLKQVQEETHAWISQFKEGYWPPLANLARLAEEVGELARELGALHGPKRKKPTEAVSNVALELGDILFVVAAIANQHQVALEDAFQAVLAKYRQRDGDRWERVVAPPLPDGTGE